MKGKRKGIIVVLLLMCLVLHSGTVFAGSASSAPKITVTLKEKQTVKHRTIGEGSVLQIVARSGEQLFGRRELKYRSSDKDVAIVSPAGLIWILSEGDVEISVSTCDGKLSASIRLSVKDRKNLLTAVV